MKLLALDRVLLRQSNNAAVHGHPRARGKISRNGSFESSEHETGGATAMAQYGCAHVLGARLPYVQWHSSQRAQQHGVSQMTVPTEWR